MSLVKGRIHNTGLALIFAIFISFISLNAQENNGIITGKIIDSETSEPIVSARVSLYKTKDSSLTTGTYSTPKGNFEIDKIPNGNYYVQITFVGYSDLTLSNIVITGAKPRKNLDEIKLTQISVKTSGVTVTAEKPLVEFSMDKKVINVEKNIVSAGGSAVDVLQNVPSVTVDVDGNVSLRGSQNVQILIDGKPSPVSGTSRSAILEQIPASSIENIEIMTNPSAKYNPEGMSGVININLKKKSNLGLNGMLSMNVGMRDKYNPSVHLNYGMDWLNLFGSLDIRSNRRSGTGSSYRTTNLNNTVSYLNQVSDRGGSGFDNNLKLGTDLMFSPEQTLTLSWLWNYSKDKHSMYQKSSELDSLKNLYGYYITDNPENSTDNSQNYSLNYKWTFGKQDHALTADFMFSTSNETENQDNTTTYYNPDMQTLSRLPYQIKINTPEYNSSGNIKINYSKPYSKDSRLDIGYQGIIRHINNDYHLDYFDTSANIWANDTNATNNFIYDENIHAVYGTYSNGFEPLKFQLGLRLEKALITADQRTTNTKYNKDYFSFFPSIHVTYKLDNTQDLQLSYSRRINRPNIWWLNPFKEYSDPLNVRVGNPDLMPEYINVYELSHSKTWGYTSILSTLFYRQINDVIKRWTYIDSSGVTYYTSLNLSSGTSYGIELIGEQTIANWWKVNANFSYFRTVIKGSGTEGDLNQDNYSWTAKISSIMTFWENMNVQISANYNGPVVTPQGEMKANYTIDIAAKKDFWDDRATLSFRIGDLLNSWKFQSVSTGTGFYIDNTRKRESRIAYITFSYKLNSGLKQKEKKRMEENRGNGDEGFD